jgi:hypothetical protein
VAIDKARENDLMQLFEALDYYCPVRKVKFFHLIDRLAVGVSFHQLIDGLRNPFFIAFHTLHRISHKYLD